MAGHALLSPSAAHRWTRCTAAPLTEATIPDVTSEYAAEGTAAHALAEAYLLGGAERITKAKSSMYYNAEMEEHVQGYVAYAKSLLPTGAQAVEVRVDLSHIAPKTFGTVDYAAWGYGDLHVLDLKYGQGVRVEAEGNSQAMVYASGVLRFLDDAPSIERVHIHIYQPRVNNVAQWTVSVAELNNWIETVAKPAAAEALNGGRFVPGAHCKFCRAAGTCAALAQFSIEAAFGDAATLSGQALAEAYGKVETVKVWAEAISAKVYADALAGNPPPGYKLSLGQLRRYWTDTDEVAALVSLVYGEDAAVKRTTRGIGDIEKLMSKDQFEALLGGLVEKKRTAPSVVPVSRDGGIVFGSDEHLQQIFG